jgi:hypothetical protein
MKRRREGFKDFSRNAIGAGGFVSSEAMEVFSIEVVGKCTSEWQGCVVGGSEVKRV